MTQDSTPQPLLTETPIPRRRTRAVRVGPVQVGGGAPIAVQSMTTTDTRDVTATVAQIQALTDAGCEIVRVAVPDAAAAAAVSDIKNRIAVPLVADIHFDHRLALAAARAGADALRINPGNIGGPSAVGDVVACARDLGLSIRIGVNSGSVEKNLLQKFGGATADALVESAMGQVRRLTSLGFDQIKISVKASDVRRTWAAYRRLSRETDFPLHLGVTEAGTLFAGIVKSALGIGTLLSEGIGDTIRVSLTRDPVDEIRAAYAILQALGIRSRGPEIVSCPTCGRCRIDLFSIVDRVEAALQTMQTPLKIAVMGCAVNGPGEAREADIGVAGGDGVGILFKKGQVVQKFPQDRLVEVLLHEIKNLEREKGVS